MVGLHSRYEQRIRCRVTLSSSIPAVLRHFFCGCCTCTPVDRSAFRLLPPLIVTLSLFVRSNICLLSGALVTATTDPVDEAPSSDLQVTLPAPEKWNGDTSYCEECKAPFSLMKRRHHVRELNADDQTFTSWRTHVNRFACWCVTIPCVRACVRVHASLHATVPDMWPLRMLHLLQSRRPIRR